MAVLRVRVWRIGEHVTGELDDLVRRLNRCQDLFRFESMIDTELVPPPEAQALKPPFCADAALYRLFPVDPGDDADFHAAITSYRISTAADMEGPGYDIDYFGLCDVSDPVSARKAVFSTALWEQRYEPQALRDTWQYLALMFVFLLGDGLAMNEVDARGEPVRDPRRLSHIEFRWCCFDYNDDLDSIVQSVRKARLCPLCRRRIATARYRVNGRTVEGRDALWAFDAMLLLARRPTLHNVFRYLHGQAITSLAFFTVMVSVLIDVVLRQADGSLFVAAGVLLVFVAALFWLRYRPTRGLG